MKFGDMIVADAESTPAALLKALAVIADTLHPAFDRQGWLLPGKSKESCVLCALTVRDFLQRIGIEAGVRSCCAIMRAARNGKELHSLGLGSGLGGPREQGRWDGHLVTLVPGARILIDTTLYQTKRPQWAEVLPGMMAVPYGPVLRDVDCYGMHPFANISAVEGDYRFDMLWLDRRTVKRWQHGPDALPWRRAVATAALCERFGSWEGE